MKTAPITLQGHYVTLVPLIPAHSKGIADLLDPSLTEYFPRPFRCSDDVQAMIDEALNAQAAGSALPFTTIDNASGQIVGGHTVYQYPHH